jgi:hypothetical protein
VRLERRAVGVGRDDDRDGAFLERVPQIRARARDEIGIAVIELDDVMVGVDCAMLEQRGHVVPW